MSFFIDSLFQKNVNRDILQWPNLKSWQKSEATLSNICFSKKDLALDDTVSSGSHDLVITIASMKIESTERVN